MREKGTPEFSALAGSLLLAHPTMRDENFRRSVIMLSSHDQNGAMGVILNRPTGRKLGDLNSEFAAGPLASVPLFQGGPVEADRLLLCAWRMNPDISGFQLMFGIDPQKALELRADEGMALHGFLGYAGWTGGQLENELRLNTWVVSPMIPSLFSQKQDGNLWRHILLEIDNKWKLLADEPDDPSRN